MYMPAEHTDTGLHTGLLPVCYPQVMEYRALAELCHALVYFRGEMRLESGLKMPETHSLPVETFEGWHDQTGRHWLNDYSIQTKSQVSNSSTILHSEHVWSISYKSALLPNISKIFVHKTEFTVLLRNTAISF